MPVAHATARTPDGVDIAWYDHGGRGPDLLLAHATGFCGGIWEPMARRLLADFRVVTFDSRGHGASAHAPGENYDWHGFAGDAIAVVDAAGLDRPFAGGHSCGGALLFLAEQASPGTFKALWSFEPIAFPTEVPPGFDNPMAAAARRRRAVFGSRAEARANYASKPPLDELDAEVLDAYVEHGFVETDDGVRLACDPEVEARTFEMGGRHDAFKRMHEVACPVTLLCGEHSNAIGPEALALQAEKLADVETDVWTGHGHFAPLVDPERAAASIVNAFAS